MQYTGTNDIVLVWQISKIENRKYLQILTRTYFSNYFML